MSEGMSLLAVGEKIPIEPVDPKNEPESFNVGWGGEKKPPSIEQVKPDEIVPELEEKFKELAKRVSELHKKREDLIAKLDVDKKDFEKKHKNTKGEIRSLEQRIAEESQPLGELIGDKFGQVIRHIEGRLIAVVRKAWRLPNEPDAEWKLRKLREIAGSLGSNLDELDTAFDAAVKGFNNAVQKEQWQKEVREWQGRLTPLNSDEKKKLESFNVKAGIIDDVVLRVKMFFSNIWNSLSPIVTALDKIDETTSDIDSILNMKRDVNDMTSDSVEPEEEETADLLSDESNISDAHHTHDNNLL
jgi:chromosome segregation ATPase